MNAKLEFPIGDKETRVYYSVRSFGYTRAKDIPYDELIISASFFYIDIDLKDGDYATAKDAILAVETAVSQRLVPMYTYYLHTGGGIHFYWKPDADIPVDRWDGVNEQLRESNNALRKANEAGVGDAHLINKAMLAELEALRATRVADMGEMESIMDAIKPMIGTAKEGA